MKRFLVFKYEMYSACGGIHDLVLDTDDIQEAMGKAKLKDGECCDVFDQELKSMWYSAYLDCNDLSVYVKDGVDAS